MEKGKATPTERTLAAIENRYVTIIGHPSGRLLNRRPAMELDMARIAETGAQSHTALEINASWQRLDLKDVHARQAAQAGVMLAINTDAHATGELERIHYGVTNARRAGIRADQVINAMPLADMRNWISRKRG
jgi:DNA polymerase (family 10)